MQVFDLQTLCEQGQDHLMRMDYLSAEAILAEAERIAWDSKDFDTLSRLYMPLQEARRQRRQRAGEGKVRLDLLAAGPDDSLDAESIAAEYPHGQLLVAGWGTIEPAIQFRALQENRKLYVDTFLGAVYPVGAGKVVVIVPTADVKLPAPVEQSIDQLMRQLPIHSMVLSESDLPAGEMQGTPQTYAKVMALWEKLHSPFLAAADASVDNLRKMEGYRKTIAVDYACELAHQHLSDVARNLHRRK